MCFVARHRQARIGWLEDDLAQFGTYKGYSGGDAVVNGLTWTAARDCWRETTAWARFRCRKWHWLTEEQQAELLGTPADWRLALKFFPLPRGDE